MIVSKRLEIRLVERKDFKQIHAIKNDPDVIRGEGHSFSFPFEKLEKIYSSYLSENSARKALVIVDRKRKGIIGEISMDVDWPNRCADIGITVARKRWGKGIATEALGLVKRHAFDRMGLNRVQAWVMSTNIPSLKAFQAAGFIKEGTFRKARMYNGKFTDVIWVAAIAGDKRI